MLVNPEQRQFYKNSTPLRVSHIYSINKLRHYKASTLTTLGHQTSREWSRVANMARWEKPARPTQLRKNKPYII